MKKVLILAYDFPPYVSVGGLRPYSWYKYLNEFGYYPIVVTRQWGNKYGNHRDYIAEGDSNNIVYEESDAGMIIRAPYKPNLANQLQLKHGEGKFKLIRKLVSGYFELMQYPFPIGPKSSIYTAAKKYLIENKVDLIIATGDPFVLFTYASKLGKKHNCPWIADYRDFWSQYINVKNNFLLRNWFGYYEKRALKSVSCITVVSDFLKIRISELTTNSNFKVIPNGYDPQAFNNISDIKQNSEVLSIAYVGTIYGWHPLRSFLNVLRHVIRTTQASIHINFYGVNLDGSSFNSSLDEIIKTEYSDIALNITVHKRIPNAELIIKLAKNNVMLLFNYYSYMGTKIFDYMAIKRTILLCYSNDPESNEMKRKHYNIEEVDGVPANLQEEFILRNNAGFIARDKEHLERILNDLVNEFKLKNSIECNTKNDNSYSRKELTRQLANVFKEVLNNE